MPEHRIKDDIRLHAHHGNEPAIGQLYIVHLQIGEHIYCRLKEKSLFSCATDYFKTVSCCRACCNSFEFMVSRCANLFSTDHFALIVTVFEKHIACLFFLGDHALSHK